MAISGALVIARQRGLSAVRANMEGALARLRVGSWPVVQTAVAATLAWSAAALVLGHEQPFVAAIAAVISVGAVAGQTLKRAAEWILGVAVGLTVADLIMLAVSTGGIIFSYLGFEQADQLAGESRNPRRDVPLAIIGSIAIGTGPVQTGVIVGLAMFAALLIRSGVMFVTEAGVSAVLVAGLDPTTSGVSPDRFLEALVGGGAALAVSAVFPSNPSTRARQAARPVLEDLATALRNAAAGLIGGNLELAEAALSEARRIDAPVARLREELEGGYQIARLSPPRRRHLGHLGYYVAAADQLDLAARDTRVLARAAVALVREKGAASGELAEAILGLALAVEALAGNLERPGHTLDDARQFALGAAGEATSVLQKSNDLETSALVAQIRSTAIDLLQAAGMESSEALEALREASRPSSG